MHVNLLFGFLGSGKTTLAKHLLAEAGHEMKTAVIVNEFGEVGIDGEILRGRDIDVIELNSGCMCCTLRGSLALGIEELRGKGAERVIVEATGVAQPAELLETLDDAAHSGIDVGPLVTVVDAHKFPKLSSMLGDFYVDQIENADILILNKIDLVTADQLESAARELRSLNAEADLIVTERGRVAPQALFETRSALIGKLLDDGGSSALATTARDAAPSAEHEHQHHEHPGENDPHADAPVQSFVVRSAGSAVRANVEQFFAGLPDTVYRAKGFMHVDGGPALVQYSLGQLEITPAPDAPTEGIVFIGNSMDRPRIEAAFVRAARP